MAQFVVNKPVVQSDPVVKVEVSADNPLPLGENRFELVVIDNAGNKSAPTMISIIVRDAEAPTAILDMIDDNGKVIDPIIPFGSSFILSAARSSDVAPGKIESYHFTLLDRV